LDFRADGTMRLFSMRIGMVSPERMKAGLECYC